MKILKKLSGLFSRPSQGRNDDSFWIAVQCDRCGEVIRTRIDLINDLSPEYGEGERQTAYFCRKMLIGRQGCYVPIEVELRFDAHRRLIDRQITGGKFAEDS